MGDRHWFTRYAYIHFSNGIDQIYKIKLVRALPDYYDDFDENKQNGIGTDFYSTICQYINYTKWIHQIHAIKLVKGLRKLQKPFNQPQTPT
jgi:hypothetical protein